VKNSAGLTHGDCLALNGDHVRARELRQPFRTSTFTPDRSLRSLRNSWHWRRIQAICTGCIALRLERHLTEQLCLSPLARAGVGVQIMCRSSNPVIEKAVTWVTKAAVGNPVTVGASRGYPQNRILINSVAVVAQVTPEAGNHRDAYDRSATRSLNPSFDPNACCR
jgi:hypothetical protein